MASDRTVRVNVVAGSNTAVKTFEDTALAANKAGATIGDSIEKGSSKASGALSKLSNMAANFGLPFTNSLMAIGDHFDKASTKGKNFTATVSEVGKVALLGGAASLVAFGGEAIKLGNALEDSQSQLKAAVSAAGESMKQWQGPIYESQQKMEALGFTNADVNSALAKSVISTQDVGKSLNVLSIAADLARAKHVDLGTAIDAVDRAAQGNTRALMQMGISLPIATTNALKLQQASDAVSVAQAKVTAIQDAGGQSTAQYQVAVDALHVAEAKLAQQHAASSEILDALSKRLSGQAAAAADTFSGKIGVLKTQAEDVGAKIGTVLIPVVEGLVGFLAKNKTAVEGVAIAIGVTLGAAIAVFAVQKVQAFIGGITTMVQGLAGLVTKMTTTAEAVVGEDGAIVTANEAAGLSFTAMLGPIGAVALAAGAMWEILKPSKLSSSDVISGITPASALGSIQGDIKSGQSPSIIAGEVGAANYGLQKNKAGQHLIYDPTTNSVMLSAAKDVSKGGTDLSGAAGLSSSAANAALVAALQQAAAAGASTAATKAHAAASTKLNADELALQKSGTDSLNSMVNATHHASLSQLDIDLNATHTAATSRLVSELDATHNAKLEALATRLVNAQASEDARRTSILSADAKSGTAALNAQVNLTTSTSLATLNTGLNATHNRALVQLENTLKATHDSRLLDLEGKLVDTHRQALANWAAQSLAAEASARLAQAGSSAQIVGYQETVNEDKANMAGLTGDALSVAQAQLALDQRKLDDATQSAQLQQAVDNASSSTAKANAQAALDNFNAQSTVAQANLQASLSWLTNMQTLDANASSAVTALSSAISSAASSSAASGAAVSSAAAAAASATGAVTAAQGIGPASAPIPTIPTSGAQPTLGSGSTKTDIANYDKWYYATYGTGADIPAFAGGGVVNSPTLALVGEQGPEAIVPLGKGSSMGHTIYVNVESQADPAQIGSAVSWALKNAG